MFGSLHDVTESATENPQKLSEGFLSSTTFTCCSQHNARTASQRRVKRYEDFAPATWCRITLLHKALFVPRQSRPSSVPPFSSMCDRVQGSLAFITLTTSGKRGEKGARLRRDASWMPTPALNLTGTAGTVHQPFLLSTHSSHHTDDR